MGVRGLTTYLNYNSNIFMKDYDLHNTNLVIDGHSLCAQLYRSLNCFSAFGGDYDKFAAYVKTFFKNLKKCKVTPYVIFDGSYEKRKLRTAHSRLRSKIYGAARLDPVTQGSLQIFPLLLREVFKEVIKELTVMYTICEFEADDEIAALARYLNCPVLSYDSDFFIYNVVYIPFNSLEIKPKQILYDEKKVFAMECKIYKVEFLTKHFGGIEKELLPLLATLLGNDFVEKKVFCKFFSQLKTPKGKKSKNEQQRCIHGLFLWLQNETLESAITKIIGRLKKHQKKKVFAIIMKSIKGYNKKECKSLKYFNLSNDSIDDIVDIKMPDEINDDDIDNQSDESGSFSSNDESDKESNSGHDIEESLPEWIAEGIRHKTIPHSFINLYTHHLHFCSPQAEDYLQDDAHYCILPILRYAFDILTDFEQEHFVYVSREKDCNYRRIIVGKEFAVSKPIILPISQLIGSQLHAYFYHFFKEKLPQLNFEVLKLLPSNFQLFALALLWWVSNCDVVVGQLHSLIMCYTYLDAIDEKVGSTRSYFHFNKKFSNKILELKERSVTEITDDLQMNKNKVQYDDCIVSAAMLLKNFEIDETIRKKPKSYNSRRIHTFAQFQCCLYAINSLNTLCGSPFESTIYSKSYNGTFIYNMALKLEKESDPMLYLQKYLFGATSVLCFYKSLNMVLCRLINELNLKFKDCNMGKKKNRRRKTDEEITFLIKEFESEVKI
ncbi:protein asteroid [Pieris rapae]|uniref:protein asteroid n=1 Tax=Pieris rapae TaxID=64459 RepID=UPI001E27B3B4|nr:protein asteroid [Pieris rapae]